MSHVISKESRQILRLSQYLQNHFFQWMFLFSFLVHSVLWGLLLYFVRPSEIPILLRYNVYLGLDLTYVVSWYEAYGIPLLGGIFLFLNVFFSFFFFRRGDYFASYIVLLGGIFIQITALISVIAVILINT